MRYMEKPIVLGRAGLVLGFQKIFVDPVELKLGFPTFLAAYALVAHRV
jgi:hypothetical protein